MIGWFCLKGTKVEYLALSAAGFFCCCLVFCLGGVGFFGFVLLFGFFCQGFCEALTGLSGSLLRQLCVGK